MAGSVVDAWRTGLDRDWSARAGTLEWSCAKTADHAVDALMAPAFFLASRRTDRYPAGGWSLGGAAQPEMFIEGVEVGARILGSVVATTPDDVRAILFRHYGTLGRPADFVPRGALELVLQPTTSVAVSASTSTLPETPARTSGPTSATGRSGVNTGRRSG